MQRLKGSTAGLLLLARASAAWAGELSGGRSLRTPDIRFTHDFESDPRRSDESVVDRHIKSVVAELRRKLGLKDRSEYGHYGSGYASYVDCWLYREDANFRTGEEDEISYCGFVVPCRIPHGGPSTPSSIGRTDANASRQRQAG